ncbi:MAG: hypothetical protein IJB73_04095 [Firmicutes bacterium]|nr:hypothetical protein [Bacillota bacterium]
MKAVLRKTIVPFAAALVICCGLCAVDADAAISNVEQRTQEQIVLYAQDHPTNLARYEESGKSLYGYKITYDEEPLLESPYEAGALSDAELVCALNTVKTIRYIAGISDEVYLSDNYNSLTQASSIVNYANGKLSHTPGMPAGMDYSLASEGITGAKNSNIAWTSWKNNSLKWTIIHGWMDDSDEGNLPVLGHRRWILNPSLGMTGFGSVTGESGTYNAMYIMDKSNPDDSYTGVAWPAANTPVSYFASTSPWSFSVGEEVADTDVVVSLLRARDSKIWTFSKYYSDGEFYVDNQNYGQKGCIIFRPEDIGGYEPGDHFYVVIYIGDEEYSYEVNFFNLDGYFAPAVPDKPTVSLNDMNKPAIEWKPVKNADKYTLYRKSRGGSWTILADDLDDCYYDDASAGKGIRYYYRVTASNIVSGTNYESDFSASTYRTVPLDKPSITSLKATAKKTNYVKWSSVSKATGYEVYRRPAGSTKWTKMKTTSNKYYKNTSAKSGVKYQYRVRAYRTYNGYKVYSSYSSYKSVKTK